jgi:hypothetical protein
MRAACCLGIGLLLLRFGTSDGQTVLRLRTGAGPDGPRVQSDRRHAELDTCDVTDAAT